MISLAGIALIFFFLVLAAIAFANTSKREDYKDPIWMDQDKLYNNYYSRSNGSIYGTPQWGWNLFSGVNFYPKAY